MENQNRNTGRSVKVTKAEAEQKKKTFTLRLTAGLRSTNELERKNLKRKSKREKC